MMSRLPGARRGAPIISAALLAVAIAAPADAHVTAPDGGAIPSGSTSVIHLRVAHGCEGADTDTIEVQIPEGIVAAQPGYIAGWTVEVETVETEPYERFGETLTERVGVIRWSGGPLPDVAWLDFGIQATFLLEPGTVVPMPVVQRCGDLESAWIEPVVEGQPEPEHPAPRITITDPLPTPAG